jgi:hypothetical protein
MSGPIEMRLYAKKFTMDDLKQGVLPIRDGADLYCPALIQYRYKQRLVIAGKGDILWSDWMYIPFVKQTDDEKES